MLWQRVSEDIFLREWIFKLICWIARADRGVHGGREGIPRQGEVRGQPGRGAEGGGRGAEEEGEREEEEAE